MRAPLAHAVLLLGILPGTVAADAITWLSDYADAREKALQTGRLLIVNVHAEWCGPCKRLQQTTLRDPQLVRFIHERCLALDVDADANPDLVAGFKVSSYPTQVFVGPDGRILGRIEGFVDADEYLAKAKLAAARIPPPSEAGPLARRQDSESPVKPEGLAGSPARTNRERAVSAPPTLSDDERILPPPARLSSRVDAARNLAGIPTKPAEPKTATEGSTGSNARPAKDAKGDLASKVWPDSPPPPPPFDRGTPPAGKPATDELASVPPIEPRRPARTSETPARRGSESTEVAATTTPALSRSRTAARDGELAGNPAPRIPMAKAEPEREPEAVPERPKSFPIGLAGFCPVTMVKTAELRKGDPDLTLVYRNQQFRFRGASERDLFLQHPERYLPAENGHCVVTFADRREWKEGEIRYPALFDDRLFLFPGKEERDRFLSDPEKFVDRKGRAIR
jgi:thiol-disulfide isomerase/thioredoxin